MRERTRTPAFLVLSHPVVVVAVTLLIINDHFLKDAWPSPLTGKLSDFAGLIFFPLLLAALIELVGMCRPKAVLMAACIAVTGTSFAAVQLSSRVADVYAHTLGWLQQPVRELFEPGTWAGPVAVTQDVTDLFALFALIVPWRLYRAAASRVSDVPDEVVGVRRELRRQL